MSLSERQANQKRLVVVDYFGQRAPSYRQCAGEALMVTVQHPGGWWMAQRGNGEKGWVPASYLKAATPDADAKPARDVSGL